MKAIVKKRFLPNYGVFDEFRYFAPGDELFLFELGDTLVGVTICEDMWQPGPPATDLALAGAELIVNISASPFHLGKDREREEMFRTRARDNCCVRRVLQHRRRPGRADLRRALARDRRRGTVLARAPGFEEALLVRSTSIRPRSSTRRLTDARRRALAQDRGELGAGARRSTSASRTSRSDTVAAAARPVRGRPRADAARARARARRLRAQERLQRDRRRRLRRDRLGARRRARRRGARRGARALRLDAVALLVGGHARRRAAARGESRLRLPRDPDRADRRGVRRARSRRRSPTASPI